MRYLFVASTPLQLYYASSIVLEKLHSNDTADLLLTDQFPDASSISLRLIENKVFSKLHYCKSSFSLRYLRMMQLMAYLGKSFYHPESLKQMLYDYLVLSMPAAPNSSIYFYLKSNNPSIKVIFFEDGSGTYSGEVFKSPAFLGKIPQGICNLSSRALLYRKIFGIIPKRINSYNPVKMLVRQPQLITYKCDFPVEKVTLSESNCNRVFSCFKPVNNEKAIKSNSVIFIDPARTPNEAIKQFDVIDDLIQTASKLKTSIFLREHPRTTIHSNYQHLCTDLSGGLWESFARKTDLSSCLLVGIGSTAQFAPAMENHQKPALLFLYKLFFNENDPTYSHYERIIKIAKQLYGSDSNHLIFCPSRYEEAENVIKFFDNP